jgi:hypothetical protein
MHSQRERENSINYVISGHRFNSVELAKPAHVSGSLTGTYPGIFPTEPPRSHEQTTQTYFLATVTLASPPPNTLKADIRLVDQQFREVECIFAHLGRRCFRGRP